MKKLLLLFAVVLSTVGAWAQSWDYATNVVIGNKITDLSSIEDGQKVVFKLVSTNTYITLDSKADADMSASVSGLSVFSLHKGTGDNESKFSIESSKDGFYFPEITHDGGWKEYIMTETPVYYEFLTTTSDDVALSSGQFVIKCSTTTGYFDGDSGDFTAWQGKGGNCKYEIYAVNALYYFKDAYDLFQSGFYSVQCPNKSNVYAMFDGTRITYNGKKDNTKSVFYFEKGDGNKYTIRLSDGRYITYKGTGTGDQIEFKLPAEATDANKWWQICSGKVSGRFVIVPDQQEISNSTPGFNFAVRYKKEGDANEDANGALGLWNCDDNNTQWVLAPVSAPMFAQGKAKIKVQNIFLKKEGDYLRKGDTSNFELFTFTKDSEKNRYTIQTSDGTYLTYSGTGNGTQVAFAEPTDENKWWIIESNNGLASGAAYPVDIYPYTESFNKNNAAWNFAISVNNQANQAVGLWSASGNNSYCELFWEIESSLTDVAENVHKMTEYGVAGFFDPTLSGAADYTLSNKCWNGNKFTADIDFGFPVSKDGGVTNATMIRQGSWEKATAPKKWYAALEGEEYYVKVKTQGKTTEYVPSVSEVASWLWAIYPKYDNDNGAFSFSVKNINTGTYVAANTSVTGDFQGNKKPISLETTPTYFTIESRNAGKMFSYMAGENLDSKHYLTINSENDTDVYLGSYTGTHPGNDINFPIISYTASITSAKAATLYTPVAVTIPEGVTAKYVKAEGENMGSTGKLVYTKLNDVIPANSAVVLTGEAGNYTFTATTEAGEEVADNVLFGYATETAATDNTGIYALANKTNGVAFYPFVGTTYKAGKAYLNKSGLSASEVRFFNIFDEDMETAIEGVEAVDTKSEIYDLAGRRVQNAQKGVFIVNGKVVIK